MMASWRGRLRVVLVVGCLAGLAGTVVFWRLAKPEAQAPQAASPGGVQSAEPRSPLAATGEPRARPSHEPPSALPAAKGTGPPSASGHKSPLAPPTAVAADPRAASGHKPPSVPPAARAAEADGARPLPQQPDEGLLPPAVDTPEARRLVAVLRDIPWHEKRARKAELDEATRKLAAMGDGIIRPLMAQLNEPGQSSAFRRRAIAVLQALGTSLAQRQLLDIALGRTNVTKEQTSWGARAYVATLKDKRAAAPLLGSARADVQNLALLTLKGQSVDGALLPRLAGLLASDNEAVRWAAAGVLGKDPESGHVADKVAALVAAAERTSNMANGNQTYPRSHFTRAEMDYAAYIRALAEMRDGGNALEAAASKAKGMARHVVAIARGRRGDAAARAGLRAVLDDPTAGLLRMWAAQALGAVGTTSDVPALERAAKSDPLRREYPPSRGSEAPQAFYPVRGAAQAAIKVIRSRTAEGN